MSFFPAIQLGTEAFPTAHLEPRRDLRECHRCFPPQPRRQGQLTASESIESQHRREGSHGANRENSIQFQMPAFFRSPSVSQPNPFSTGSGGLKLRVQCAGAIYHVQGCRTDSRFASPHSPAPVDVALDSQAMDGASTNPCRPLHSVRHLRQRLPSLSPGDSAIDGPCPAGR